MKNYILLLVAVSTLASSCATLGALGIKPTSLETVMALKNILNRARCQK